MNHKHKKYEEIINGLKPMKKGDQNQLEKETHCRERKKEKNDSRLLVRRNTSQKTEGQYIII